jgi:hypothetical protein
MFRPSSGLVRKGIEKGKDQADAVGADTEVRMRQARQKK